jgi:hypothetical protein
MTQMLADKAIGENQRNLRTSTFVFFALLSVRIVTSREDFPARMFFLPLPGRGGEGNASGGRDSRQKFSAMGIRVHPCSSVVKTRLAGTLAPPEICVNQRKSAEIA